MHIVTTDQSLTIRTAFALLALLAACADPPTTPNDIAPENTETIASSSEDSDSEDSDKRRGRGKVRCDPDNGGITLPRGFCAVVVGGVRAHSSRQRQRMAILLSRRRLREEEVLAPEYGGDGQKVQGPQGINCAKFNQPLVTFGAHWAPNGLHFYSGKQFPRRFRGGAFVAFHGGFDRAPLPNEGFQVQFVPFGRNGRPSGRAETFADGFAGPGRPLPAAARHRPVGVTEGPDGSLYISDDRGGRIWRVVFMDNRKDRD